MLVGNGHKKNCEHHVRVIAFALFLTALPADNRCKLFAVPTSHNHPQSARGYFSRDT